MIDSVSMAEVQAQQRSDETRAFVRQVKRVNRRRFTPEEKVRVVLEGFRSELYRRAGIRRGCGGPGGIRTHDSRIRSPELFR